MNEKVNKIIIKSAYKVSGRLNHINAVMCAQGCFNGENIDETDINKMLIELCPSDFIDFNGDIQKDKGLEYIKKIYFPDKE